MRLVTNYFSKIFVPPGFDITIGFTFCLPSVILFARSAITMLNLWIFQIVWRSHGPTICIQKSGLEKNDSISYKDFFEIGSPFLNTI